MAKRILIVDDSATMRQMVSFTLEQAGFEVVEGVDGVDGLARAGQHTIHLVLTDLNMPRMNGIELIQSLRAKPAYRYTPILMLTTESQTSKKLEGKAAGATGWIVKPFHPQKLLETIAKVLP
jgi:two-component system chemotaxis response regulator CheY